MRLFSRFFTVLLFLTMGCLRLHADDSVAETYTDPDGKTHPYRLIKPAGYDSSQKYPVILFFHGAGQRGTDNIAQLTGASFLKNTPKFPCFVVAVQCPPDQKWVNMDWSAKSGDRPAEPSDNMKNALQILDHVTTTYSIDPQRIYLMGLSMGGYAVWDCVTRFPGRFAGAVAICGGGDEKTVTADVAKTPIWAFHSSDDPSVPVVRSENMIAAMTKAGGTPHYTEYHGLGHGSWGKAFAEPQLLPWLFAQRLGQPDTFHLDLPATDPATPSSM